MRALLVITAVLAALGAGLLVAPPRSTGLGRAAQGPRAAPRRHRETPVSRAVATVAVGVGAWTVLGGLTGAAVGAVGAVVCWLLTARMEPAALRRRRERLAAALPHVVDLLAACLAAGHSPSSAVDEVERATDPPVREELAALSARLRLGVDPVTVWRDLSRHPQLGELGRTVARAVESGASVSEAMVRLADDLRARSRSQVEGKARSVGVRAAVPLGVCLLPAFVLVGVVPLIAGAVSALLH